MVFQLLIQCVVLFEIVMKLKLFLMEYHTVKALPGLNKHTSFLVMKQLDQHFIVTFSYMHGKTQLCLISLAVLIGHGSSLAISQWVLILISQNGVIIGSKQVV